MASSSCGGRRLSSAGTRASVLLLALLVQACYSTLSWGQSVQMPEKEEKVYGERAYYISPGTLYTYPYNAIVIPLPAAGSFRAVDTCTGTLVSRERVLTSGICCWDQATGSTYPNITVDVGYGSLGGSNVQNFDVKDVFLPPEFKILSKGTLGLHVPVKGMVYNVCILKLSQPSNLMPARIAKPTTDPMTNEQAATYGWTMNNRTIMAGARLKGLPVSATSCASLGIQTKEKDADLIATWDNEGQAAKCICVVELDTVGGFGRGDAGGPLLVVDAGIVEIWGVLAGVWYDQTEKRHIAVYVNLRAPHWQTFLAEPSKPHRE